MCKNSASGVVKQATGQEGLGSILVASFCHILETKKVFFLLSQFGPMLGSGQLQAPFRQTELPGHCSLLVQATAPPQDLGWLNMKLVRDPRTELS